MVFAPVTFEGRNNAPLWTPDGLRLTYSSRRAGVQHLFWQPTDGSSPAESLIPARTTWYAGGWAPDGRSLVVHGGRPHQLRRGPSSEHGSWTTIGIGSRDTHASQPAGPVARRPLAGLRVRGRNEHEAGHQRAARSGTWVAPPDRAPGSPDPATRCQFRLIVDLGQSGQVRASNWSETPRLPRAGPGVAA